MAERRICSIPECGKAIKGRGLCPMHLWRLKNLGTTDHARDHGPTPCAIENCTRRVVANGHCELHYRRLKRSGRTDLVPHVSKRPKCSVEGCENTMHGIGLCRSHYQRKKQLEKEISTARHGEGLAFLDNAVTMETDECILWPYGASRGYGVTYIAPKNVFAHRYICERKRGAPPFRQAQAAHKCGNRICVNWRHIRWASAKENTHDKYEHGRMPMGEKVGLSKLDAEKVGYIRSSSESTTELSRRFGVNKTTIASVRKRRTWQHLP